MARLRMMGALLLLGAIAAVAWLHPRLVAAGLLLRTEGSKGGPTWLVRYGQHALDVVE